MGILSKLFGKKETISEEHGKYLDQVTKKLAAYSKLVAEYDKKLSSLPEKMLEFTRLERVRFIHAETYSFMSRKLEEARIGEASKLGKIRIVMEKYE